MEFIIVKVRKVHVPEYQLLQDVLDNRHKKDIWQQENSSFQGAVSLFLRYIIVKKELPMQRIDRKYCGRKTEEVPLKCREIILECLSGTVCK